MGKIIKNSDFQNIYKIGSKYFGKYILIYILKNNSAESNIGVVASKKVGNAVVRNRLKRLFKEVFRLNKFHLKDNYNIVIISKYYSGTKFKELKFKDIEKEYIKLLKKADVFK